MTEGNYSNVGHRGPVYKVLGAMNPFENLSASVGEHKHLYQGAICNDKNYVYSCFKMIEIIRR
jgi:hypothetical protein